MKADVNGRSTCPPGGEQYEEFYIPTPGHKGEGKNFVQYDYRTYNGVLFSCIAYDLESARAKRDEWLKAVQS